jgi:hypothetical protein
VRKVGLSACEVKYLAGNGVFEKGVDGEVASERILARVGLKLYRIRASAV